MAESKVQTNGMVNGEGVRRDAIGMTCELINLYQKIDKDGNWSWSKDVPNITAAAEDEETAKFALLVRNKKSNDSRKSLELDSIIVQSPLVKEALATVLKDYPGITTNLKRLEFSSPFRPFVHRWERLVEVLSELQDETAKSHFQILHDVLYGELKDAIAVRNDLVANKVITFEHLWTIFEPASLVYSMDDGQERLYELSSSSQSYDSFRGLAYLRLSCVSVDWDGEKFGRRDESLLIYEFDGTEKIAKLSAYPLIFHQDPLKLSDRLVLRGKQFELFAGYHYMAYKGIALSSGPCGPVKHSVESRIIIDCSAYNRSLPNKAVRISPLQRQKSGANHYEMEDLCGSEIGGPYDYSDSDIDEYSFNGEQNGRLSSGSSERQPLNKHELMLAVPYVRGYALKTKKWLTFFLTNILPIKFSEKAFASLVLPAEQKELILAFVESQVKNKDSFDDIIAGKGRGMIFMLSGPPGVGKTLTAESVAESMRVPLYSMSAGDLGLDPHRIEESLTQIMEMVAKWNAVLLLDEADVFLEARNTSDLERNKLVSIFLRMLEYYEGILFLTTNRVKQIDGAFHSRIHVSLHYPSLSAFGRRQIWKAFAGHLEDAELDSLAQVELNGRQIKNVLKTAQLLAKRGNDAEGKVRLSHIRSILAIEKDKQLC